MECFDAGREECCPFGEVAIVGNARIGLVEEAGCEACPEEAVDAERG